MHKILRVYTECLYLGIRVTNENVVFSQPTEL